MRIGLNLVYLVPGETGGTEIVARELVPALAVARRDIELTIFLNQEAAEAREPFWSGLGEVVTVPVRARSRVQWVRGEQQLLPRIAARTGVEVVHSLGNTGPAWGRFRRVVTVHDLIHRIHPEAHFGVRSLGMRILVSLAAHRSHRVIVDSESTRRDLTRLLRIPPERVDVAHLGLGSTAPVEPVSEPELRERHALGQRKLLLSVSAKRPHKNLPRLLDALALVPADRRPVLVLPGYPTPHEDELRQKASELDVSDFVRLLGWVAPAELEGLYRAADAFVFPSLYEGFGMPVLEAMSRGVPVACSNRSSLPELTGDAALLFNPERPSEIAGAIERLLGDEAEARRLRAAALGRSAQFTWRRTAEATITSYERVLRDAA
jgi:glycosyltransferase involved in cell wall biosynthesis